MEIIEKIDKYLSEESTYKKPVARCSSCSKKYYSYESMKKAESEGCSNCGSHSTTSV
jgi:hypothetical protein